MAEFNAERRARLLFAITIFVIAIAVGVWFLFSKGRVTTYEILTHDQVSGLSRDAPVEFHGVQVGKVTRVELLDPRSVRILMEVDSGAPLSTATLARITSRGLSPKGFTGYAYISLEESNAEGKRLVAAAGERYPRIATVPARDMSLDMEISQANELIHRLLDQATVTSLKASVESVQRIAQTLADNNARLGSLITHSEQASKQLAPLLQSSTESLQALQRQVLPEAYKALSDLENLSNALNGTAEAIGRDPSILLRGREKPAPAPGEKQ